MEYNGLIRKNVPLNFEIRCFMTRSSSIKLKNYCLICTSGPILNFMTHTLKNVQSLNFERKSAPGLVIKMFPKFAITFFDTSYYRKKWERYFPMITSGPGVKTMTHTLKNAQSSNFERKAAPNLVISIFSKFAITYIETSCSRKKWERYFQIITSGPGVKIMTHTLTKYPKVQISNE